MELQKIDRTIRRRRVFWFAVLWLVALLAALSHEIPLVFRQYQGNIILSGLLKDISSQRPLENLDCDSLDPTQYLGFSNEQRLTVGSILRMAGCLDLAEQIIPTYSVSSSRSDLLAYQLGQTAWVGGDHDAAVEFWQLGEEISQSLLHRARTARADDIEMAMQLYEAAIFTAATEQMRADALWTYTFETREFIDKQVFCEHLAGLAAHFGSETALGHRLEGQRLIGLGSPAKALPEFKQAVQLGLNDSETWYWIGYIHHWILPDPVAAEAAYRNSLNAPIQISPRRPYYLYQMAVLVASLGRVEEAITLQEDALRLHAWYKYQDFLAVLYSQMGETEKAFKACEKARELAGAGLGELHCTMP